MSTKTLQSPQPSCRWLRVQWLATVLTALCVLLLVVEIQRPSYWIDEKVSVDIASADSAQQVIENVIQDERRPPAYHLGLWAWMRLIGSTERAARLYSVAWMMLFVPATFQLARKLTDEGGALFAAFLAASSPIVISYGQTVRYYAMVAALSALSYTWFLAVMRQKHKPWTRYALVTLALLYCDYPAYGVVAAQNLLAILWWRDRSLTSRHPHWKWIGIQTCLATITALWIPVVLVQSTRDFGAADLSNSLTGAALKIVYPFYAWTVGETLFPWTFLALVGILIGGLLLVHGFIQLKRRHARMTWLIAFAAPFSVSQVLLAVVATDSPFVNAPARSMACAALLYALLGTGLARLNPKWLQCVALIGLTIIHGLALANYYRGVDFINSIYNTPAREVAHAITAQTVSGDAIVSEGDSLIEFYLPGNLRASHFFPQQMSEIQAYLMAHPQAAVWQVTMGRDRTRNNVSLNLSEWLKTRYVLCASTGFAEKDAVYRELKSRLLGREAYRYRLQVDKYCPQ